MERENNNGKGRDWKYVSPFHDPAKEVERTIQEQENWYNRPHEELVRIIQNAITQTHEEHQVRGWDFDPMFWLGEHVGLRNPVIHHTAYEAIHNPVAKLVRAYTAISSPYIKDPHTRSVVKGWAMDDAAMHGNIITLDPSMVKLLDAMTEAVSIPHDRGQTIIDQLVYINLCRSAGNPLPRNTQEEIAPRPHETAAHAQSTDEPRSHQGERYRRFGAFYVDTHKAQPIMADWWNNIHNTWTPIRTKKEV